MRRFISLILISLILISGSVFAASACEGCDSAMDEAVSCLRRTLEEAQEYLDKEYMYTHTSYEWFMAAYNEAVTVYNSDSHFVEYWPGDVEDARRYLESAIDELEPWYVIDGPVDYVYGEVNGDEKITIGDATTIQKYLADLLEISKEKQKCADVNDDMSVDIKDVTVIQKFLAAIPMDRCYIGYKPTSYVTVNGVTYSCSEGDVITYTASLQADEIFEDIQGIVRYDRDVLDVVIVDTGSVSSMSKYFCPNLVNNCVANVETVGGLKFNAVNIYDGFDFTEEKVLVTMRFIVGRGDSEIQLDIQYMTILGDGTEMYFYDGQPVITDGISVWERL